MRQGQLRAAFVVGLGLACMPAWGQVAGTEQVHVHVDWGRQTGVSQATPTLQVVVNPQLLRGARLHDPAFQALHELGADYVRYVPWLPYPRQAVAELQAPEGKTTSWDFEHIDPALDDFMRATAGHSVILNFSTIPAWMFKTAKPVAYPDDPNQVTWSYTQGTEMRDPTYKEAADYFARLLSWYTQGGFTDEAGVYHRSGHHYKIAYWEVLNEIEYEHHWTPEAYTRFYDAVTEAMHKVDPELKFMALAMADPRKSPEMFEYFLNPAHHRAGAPLDFITYHFYASPAEDEAFDSWAYTFFDQERGFLDIVRYIEVIRKHYSPATRTDLDELGVILKEDEKENNTPGYVGKPEPALYWNLAAALYADLYLQLAQVGIEVVGESQLVGYPTQFPSVTMLNYKTGAPNARFWVLKLIKDNFGPGDKLVATSVDHATVSALGFVHGGQKELLLINHSGRPVTLSLPADAAGAAVEFVAPSTGDHPAAKETLATATRTLQPFEVAVVHLP